MGRAACVTYFMPLVLHTLFTNRVTLAPQARKLLLDWISGRAGGDADAALAAKVVCACVVMLREPKQPGVSVTYIPPTIARRPLLHGA
jgi:hypothetical protein